MPTGYLVFLTGDVGLAGLWWLWAAFFVLLALQYDEYTGVLGTFTAATGVMTAVAGYLMAAGFWLWPYPPNPQLLHDYFLVIS